MADNNIDKDADLTLELVFNDLYNFFRQTHLISFEYIHDRKVVQFLSLPSFNIKVDNIPSPSLYQMHIRELIDNNFPSYISYLMVKKPSVRIVQINGLIDEIEDYIGYIYKDINYEGNSFGIFKNYKLEGENADWRMELFERRHDILECAEPFVKSMVSALSNFTNRLEQTKQDFAFNSYKFKYIETSATSFKYLEFSRIKASSGYLKMQKLYYELKDTYTLIPEATNFSNFIKVFSGEEVTKPIKWLDPRISTLHYFIKQLNISGKIQDTKNKHYEIACNCFIDYNGNRYNQARLKRQKRPTNTDCIYQLKTIPYFS